MKKKIFIFQQREWANRIGLYLAKKFQSNNYELGCLTFKKSTHYNITSDKSINYKIILSNDEIYENPKKFISQDLDLEIICNDLKIKNIWELVYCDRDLTNSYDKNLHFCFKKKLNDEYIINVFKAIYSVCEKVYKDFAPDIILAPNFPALTHLIFYHFFKNKNIRMIGLNDTKVGDIQAISYDYNHEDGIFHAEYEKIKNDIIKDDDMVKKFMNEFYNNKFYSYPKFNDKKFFLQLIKDFLRDIFYSLKGAFSKFKRINESKIFNHQTSKIMPIVRFYIFKILKALSERNIKYDKIKENESFAYMPLQFQPEASIDIQSSNFSNQFETARQIAMHLPSKMCLYVKDHPAMYGLRKKSFLIKLKSLPNVRLINFRTSTQDLLEKSKILIAATGSTFFEAALIKKPAIILGSLGDVIKLPNIEKLESFNQLKELVDKKLNQDFNTDEYNISLKRYIKAAIASGFDKNYVKIWEKNVIPKNNEIDYIFEKLNNVIKLSIK